MRMRSFVGFFIRKNICFCLVIVKGQRSVNYVSEETNEEVPGVCGALLFSFRNDLLSQNQSDFSEY